MASVHEEDFDVPARRKDRVRPDPMAALEERVRREVLTTSEDWITDRFLAGALGAGTKQVGLILQKMTEDGILGPLEAVPMVEEEDLHIKVHRTYKPSRGSSEYHFDVNAFVHDGKWVVGYFDKSAADARKTVLVHGRPDILRYRRVRGARGTIKQRHPTARAKESFQNSFKYKLSDWDGKARRLLRDGKPFFDACVAASIEPKTDLPWTCPKCSSQNEAATGRCRRSLCDGRKPSALSAARPKECPRCGEPDLDGHSKRHGGKKLKAAKHKCTVKMVEAVHKM